MRYPERLGVTKVWLPDRDPSLIGDYHGIIKYRGKRVVAVEDNDGVLMVIAAPALLASMASAEAGSRVSISYRDGLFDVWWH